jgi:glycosyltransferase involved in cell wall biosynthesis
VDALCNGELGLLVDPLDTAAIENAIEKILLDKKTFIPNRELLMKHFGYEHYKFQFESILGQPAQNVIHMTNSAKATMS